MIFIIIVALIVTILIWFINDKIIIQYAAKPVTSIPKPKPNVPINNSLVGLRKPAVDRKTSIPKPKPNVPINNSLVGLGRRTRKPVDRKTGIPKPKPNVPINNSLVGLGRRTRKPGESQLKYKNTNVQAPTYERLQKALAAYTKYNKSGKVDPSSSYKDLVERGYLKFENGKWTSLLDPAGKAPPVIGGPTKGSSGQKPTTSVQAPTYERLQKALAAYTKYNKSGKVDPSSSYKDLVERGYLKFENGKWTSVLDPAGKAPPVIGGPTKGSGSGGQTRKPGSGGQTRKPGSGFSQGGIVNWAWSGQTSGDKQTHDKTQYKGQDLILLDQNAPAEKVKEAIERVGDKGDVIGYMSVGSIESWRYNDLKEQGYKGPPPSGNATMEGGMKGWEGEQWVDPDKWKNAMPFIEGQMDFMKQRGFTAIEADNMSIDKNCQTKACRDKNLQFAKAVAQAAHERGMKIFMKNGSMFGNVDQTYMQQLAQTFDGLITEQANQYNDRETYQPFVEAGKAWYNFEYVDKNQNCQKFSGQTDTYYQTSNGWEKC